VIEKVMSLTKRKSRSQSMKRRGYRLRVYSLSEEVGRKPFGVLLFLNIRLYGSFFGAILNGMLLAIVMAILLIHWWIRGSCTILFWTLGQILILPFLMAGEEFLHLLIFLQKGRLAEALDLVVVYKMTSRGRKLICYGGAVRFRGLLEPIDKIHISAPGPLVSLLLAMAVWLTISLHSGSIFGEPLHIQFLPIIFCLLSSLWPFRTVLPTDMVNILRARKEGHFSMWRTLGICLASLWLIWTSLIQLLRRK
jgi:hypothetical protein